MKYFHPVKMKNKADCKCGGCGKPLKTGRPIIWFPSMAEKKSFHIICAKKYIKPKEKFVPYWVQQRYRSQKIEREQNERRLQVLLIK